MSSDLLVCLACRVIEPGTISLQTLERQGDELACKCGQRYPIVRGVPVIGLPAAEEVPLDAARLLNATDDSELAHLAHHLSTYLDAHWPPRGPLVDKLRELPPVPLTVELGCNVGGALAVMPGDRLVGIELSRPTSWRAQALLDGKTVPYLRRVIGKHYEPAEAQGIARPATIVCATALDPPLIPGRFDRVAALNVLDSVTSPLQLLSVIDALCRPGGEIIIACPYQWASEERLASADPAAELVQILRGGEQLRATYTILDEAELDWTLRRNARSLVAYRIHYVRAWKGS
ncbi:MAG: methyltransferase domain-containing protein [Deltaproteobacteria bacterium]|nr:methyltransferase domain-containing protein [Deltaproteobacteria bacterium]